MTDPDVALHAPIHALLPACEGRDLERRAPQVGGPRRWWDGPLDVEGLALGSVRAAVAAAGVLADRNLGLAVDAAHVYGAFGSLPRLRVDGRAPEAFAPLSGFFATGDGWVRLHANYPHHRAALLAALGAEDRDGVLAALRERETVEVERVVREHGGIAAAVRSRTAWRATAAGQAVDAEPWIRFELAEDTLRCREARLDGLRVVDLTRVIAGPTATLFLAALGADVLRLDPPHLPELLDQHLDRDLAKRSAVADLRRPEALAQLHSLLEGADLLVTGYRPGALHRFGLDWEQLHARHPHLVQVRLDAWGDRGPWAGARGFDSIVQAAVGIADLYREDPEARPGALPVQALDYATGYLLAAAALVLLRRRNRLGAGGCAHMSLAGTAHRLLDLPGPAGAPQPPDPVLTRTPTSFGTLQHVRPPFRCGDDEVDYRHGPLPVGSSSLAAFSWRGPGGATG
jgi:crotonobetainyl-CoA:carnitine CoA-transferase CaiB-like acyl-CoA transferase